jgi:DNA-binding transcriptional MerR regulator
MDGATYKLDELARAAGTSTRTVRYYVQRGLLPAPAFRGKDTAYGREHLVRLKAIRRLQEAYYPLDAIAVELERRSTEELERLAEGRDEVPSARPLGTSASAPPALERQSPPAPASSIEMVGRTYQRVEVLPGLELALASDAPAASRQAAERILHDYLGMNLTHNDNKGSLEP